MQVEKKSKKPFKSGLKVATVKGAQSHLITGRDAYNFHEDDSVVEVRMVKEFKSAWCAIHQQEL